MLLLLGFLLWERLRQRDSTYIDLIFNYTYLLIYSKHHPIPNIILFQTSSPPSANQLRARRGQSAVFAIDTPVMDRDGYDFYQTANHAQLFTTNIIIS
jgi:hypothetical protein